MKSPCSLLLGLIFVLFEMEVILPAPLLRHHTMGAVKRLKSLSSPRTPQKVVLTVDDAEFYRRSRADSLLNVDYQVIPLDSKIQAKTDASDSIKSLLRRQKPLPLHLADYRGAETANVAEKQSVDATQNKEEQVQLNPQKRAVTQVTVETLVVVDTAFAKQFKSSKEMDEYLSIYWNDVALRFSSIDKPKITIELIGVVPLKSSDEKFFDLAGDGSIKFEQTLKNFGQWVATTKSLPAHDFAYLMTGIPLSGDVAGFAYEGAVCQRDGKMSYSTGIGEDIGASYDTTGLAVHEIGHNLGSAHDGSSKSSKCSADRGNIMTPAPDLLQNPKSLYFSECSIKSMYANFQNDKSSCLLKKTSAKSKYPTSKKLPGQIPQVVNKICEKYVAGLDVFTFVPQGDCTKVLCTAEGYQDAERKILAPDGASCGNSKKCIFGKCQ